MSFTNACRPFRITCTETTRDASLDAPALIRTTKTTSNQCGHTAHKFSKRFKTQSNFTTQKRDASNYGTTHLAAIHMALTITS